MFGNNDDQQQPASEDNVIQASMPDPITTTPTEPSPLFGTPPTTSPATPDPVTTSPEVPEPTTSEPDLTVPELSATSTPDSVVSPTPTTPATNDELQNLKQEALQHLSPLVNHLDQNPEEKFRTTMMMIQASDDHTLIKDAFETAKQITDDKARAQALLDVINEINYFSQSNS